MFVTRLVLIYVAVQIIKRNRTMRDSVIIESFLYTINRSRD